MDKRDKNRIQDARPDVDDKTASMLRAIERSRELDPANMMTAANICDFPAHKVPHGWTYKFLAEATLGVPNSDNMRVNYVNGWQPVPASRHPEEANCGLSPYEDNVNQNVIRRRGLILCELPTITYEAQQKIKHDKINNEMRVLSTAVQKMPHDPTVPRGVLGNYDDYQTNNHNTGATFK